jgi:5-methylcytosine-specific restriction enzyme subunit McrC
LIAKAVIVREYAALSSEPVVASLDSAQVSEGTFSWLCRLHERFRASGVKIAEREGQRHLKLDQYVGFLQSPDGTTLEILPKHVDKADDLPGLRRLTARMIHQALDIPPRTAEPAALNLFDYPLSEWIIQQFLLATERIIQRGVRFEYQRVEEESRFVRGQIDLGKQLRQAPGRKHRLHIRHDIYTPDRPENRLIKSALSSAGRITRHPGNWRLAHELLHYMDPVPASTDYRADFALWRNDKLVMHYRPVRPWCELLLWELNPTTSPGAWSGISLLFPMDRLYERFVGACLRRTLAPGAWLVEQARSETLCMHNGMPWFELQPDMLIHKDRKRWVLDAKWKRLDASRGTADAKYDLSQQDFYQMFAYGHRYLLGEGDAFLIFPKTDSFEHPLPPFAFSKDLTLWVVPFDLEAEGLVEGPWTTRCSWHRPRLRPIAQAA